MRKYLLVGVAIMVGGGLALRPQISMGTAKAQTPFRGATFVQDVYYNCVAGTTCEPGATDTTAFDQSLTRVTIHSIKGEDSRLPERYVMDSTGWVRIFPATNQYFALRMSGPKPTVGTDDECSNVVPKGMKLKTSKNVLGYTAVVYEGPGGWLYDYFPGLACTGMVESAPVAETPGHPATTTVYVARSIAPSADSSLFAPGPGMIDTTPSIAIHDAMTGKWIAAGTSPADAQKRWDDHLPTQQAHLAMLDKKWQTDHRQ